MKKLVNLVQSIENHFAHNQLQNDLVSKSSVGWQLDHTLKVINSVAAFMKVSNPNDFKSKFSFTKTVVFLKEKIPRGKAKAPKYVQSYEEITLEDLRIQFNLAKNSLKEIDSLPKNSHFKHPFFGMINKPETIKFLIIHTKHHLKIVEDIVKT